MGTVRVIFSFSERITPPARLLPAPQPPLHISTFFNIYHWKKSLNENYVEYDFIMGTVIWIFSFFWTDNDRVCAPRLQSSIPHWGDTTITHILWRIAQKLLPRFSRNFGTLFRGYKGNQFALKKYTHFCFFW